MKVSGKDDGQSPSVSASELAEMGVCERLVLLEHKYGKRITLERRSARNRGRQAHQRFYAEGMCGAAAPMRDRVMTTGTGDICNTCVSCLPRWVWRRASQWPVSIRGQMSPPVGLMLDCRMMVVRTLRVVLRVLIGLVRRRSAANGGSHAD